jgi:uncharacterized protein YaaN involved in tellurite resistance
MGLDIMDNTTEKTALVKQGNIPEAKPPKGLSEAEKQQIEKTAESVVNKLNTMEGAQAIDYIDQVANVGFKAQQSASNKLDLFKNRIGKVFERKGDVSNQIADNVVALKKSMHDINPAGDKADWLVRFLEVMPFGNKLANALQKYNVRRENIADVITTIESSLTNGRNTIVQDNAELSVLNKDLESTQLVIQKNAYLAEVMANKLDEAIANTADTTKQARYKSVLFRVLARGQDLRAMEAAYEQFFATIKMYREDSALEIDTVQRMLTLGMNVINVAFGIHVALEHQRQVLEATKATKEFIGSMLIQNATAIKDNTKGIAELYKEPVIAIKDIEKAQSILLQAIDEVDRLKTTGIQTARDNIVRLKEISEEMRQKGEGNAGTILSLEAGDYRELPTGEQK